MRTLKISLLVIILSISISAQWYQQNSGTTDTFWQVQFVNEQVGWATTEQEIYKTIDGGQNWQLQYTQNPIFQIFFNSETVGWMSTWLTYGPGLLKTNDGGSNWVQVYSYPGPYEFIYDIEFTDPDTGWLVGEETISFDKSGIAEFPILFKETTDGGITWIDKNFPSIHPGGLRQIETLDYMNLIVAGYDTLFKTTNGGITWQQLPLPAIFEPADLQFINMNLGWVTGYNTLFKTTNGGVTWVQQAQPVSNFHFIASQIGWYTNENQIYHSTDGGDTWTLQNSNTSNTLHDIFFLDNNNGWAVGANGAILHTINGGIPVELISFNAEVLSNEVKLNWTTATETNNQGFEILRSAQNDKDKWNKIGFVPGHGTTTESQHYSFTDNDVKPGKYQYRLKQIDYDGTFEYSYIVEVEITFVNKFSLSQNYPNPFNPTTRMQYTISSRQLVTLKVYDLLGREIATLVNEEKPSGEYKVEFNGYNFPSGIYFYQLNSGSYLEAKKMVLIK